MDWPIFWLISYSFVLLLILALFIIKGTNRNKKKYSEHLEQKEKQLVKLQLELEENINSLDDYATGLRSEWEAMRKGERSDWQQLNDRLLKAEAAIIDAKAYINTLNQRVNTQPPVIKESAGARERQAAKPEPEKKPLSDLTKREDAIRSLQDDSELLNAAHTYGISYGEMKLLKDKLSSKRGTGE